MTDELTDTVAGGNFFTITPIRTESTHPVASHLARKPDGELILQGAYQWQEGWDKSEIEWRDIPTEQL